MHEKRKNEIRRRGPWWGLTLAIGFLLGVMLTLLLMAPLQATGQNEVVLPVVTVSDPILLTATAVIDGATSTAAAPALADPAVLTAQAQGWVDPLALTATVIIEQATLQAAGS